LSGSWSFAEFDAKRQFFRYPLCGEFPATPPTTGLIHGLETPEGRFLDVKEPFQHEAGNTGRKAKGVIPLVMEKTDSRKPQKFLFDFFDFAIKKRGLFRGYYL
jgi:hypothetical protein